MVMTPKPTKASAEAVADDDPPIRLADLMPTPSVEDIDFAETICRRAHLLDVRDDRRAAALASPDWSDLLQGVEESTGSMAARRSLPETWLTALASRRGPEVEHLLAAYQVAIARVDKCPLEPETPVEAEDSNRYRLNILTAKQFAETHYQMRWLVDRVLVEGQPCVVGAPKKGMKTTTMIDLLISLATGTTFLGYPNFRVHQPTPVLFLSGESGGFVLKDTVRRVCEAKGIEDWPAALEGNFFIGFELPQLTCDEQVVVLGETIRANGIKVVAIDPLYLCLIGAASGTGKRVDPANLFDMGPLLLSISKACLDAGATPILIHHFTKNGQTSGDLPELENMAYSGIQEFARQWILLGRREKFEPGSGLHKLWLTVGGSAGHSGEWGVDIAEGNMADDFTGRRWDVEIKPASEIRAESKDEKTREKGQKQVAEQKVKDQQLIGNAKIALDWLRGNGPETKNGWKDGLNWNSGKFGPVVAHLKATEAITPVQVRVKTGTSERTAPGYAVAPQPGETMPLGGME